MSGDGLADAIALSRLINRHPDTITSWAGKGKNGRGLIKRGRDKRGRNLYDIDQAIAIAEGAKSEGESDT